MRVVGRGLKLEFESGDRIIEHGWGGNLKIAREAFKAGPLTYILNDLLSARAWTGAEEELTRLREMKEIELKLLTKDTIDVGRGEYDGVVFNNSFLLIANSTRLTAREAAVLNRRDITRITKALDRGVGSGSIAISSEYKRRLARMRAEIEATDFDYSAYRSRAALPYLRQLKRGAEGVLEGIKRIFLGRSREDILAARRAAKPAIYLFHLRTPEIIIECAYRSLRDGGTLMIFENNPSYQHIGVRRLEGAISRAEEEFSEVYANRKRGTLVAVK